MLSHRPLLVVASQERASSSVVATSLPTNEFILFQSIAEIIQLQPRLLIGASSGSQPASRRRSPSVRPAPSIRANTLGSWDAITGLDMDEWGAIRTGDQHVHTDTVTPRHISAKEPGGAPPTAWLAGHLAERYRHGLTHVGSQRAVCFADLSGAQPWDGDRPNSCRPAPCSSLSAMFS